jgi:hypothetical protein
MRLSIPLYETTSTECVLNATNTNDIPTNGERYDMTNAADILDAAAGHLRDREETYDAPGGERSMQSTVSMFNILTGECISEEEGWLFMACLKMVRSQQGAYRADSYEDGAAYFALAGETAAEVRRARGLDEELLPKSVDPELEKSIDDILNEAANRGTVLSLDPWKEVS